MVVLNHPGKYHIASLADLGARMLHHIHVLFQQQVSQPVPFARLTRQHFVKAKGLTPNQLDQPALQV